MLFGVQRKEVAEFPSHHVISFGSHAGYLTINVDRLFLLHSLQSGVNANEATGSSNTGTEKKRVEVKTI